MLCSQARTVLDVHVTVPQAHVLLAFARQPPVHALVSPSSHTQTEPATPGAGWLSLAAITASSPATVALFPAAIQAALDSFVSVQVLQTHDHAVQGAHWGVNADYPGNVSTTVDAVRAFAATGCALIESHQGEAATDTGAAPVR